MATRVQVNVSWSPEGNSKSPSPEAPSSGRVWDALERALHETVGSAMPQVGRGGVAVGRNLARAPGYWCVSEGVREEVPGIAIEPWAQRLML